MTVYPCLAWQFQASDEAAALRDAPVLDASRLAALDNDLAAYERHTCHQEHCTFAVRAVVVAAKRLSDEELEALYPHNQGPLEILLPGVVA